MFRCIYSLKATLINNNILTSNKDIYQSTYSRRLDDALLSCLFLFEPFHKNLQLEIRCILTAVSLAETSFPKTNLLS